MVAGLGVVFTNEAIDCCLKVCNGMEDAVLEPCEASLGADHPNTQKVRGNLDALLAEIARS
jgi:hypothetical protein